MESRESTFGEKLVGLTFNPSGDEKVQRAKELCAELADLLNDDYNSKYNEELAYLRENNYNYKPHSGLKEKLYWHTIGEVLNAQMNVVKILTFKE